MLALIGRWVTSPLRHSRLFNNFTRQEFSGEFAGSLGGFLWLFVTPIVNIAIFSFVFSVVFRAPVPEHYGALPFVLFLMVGYLPWFAFADAVGKAPGMLISKAPLITKVVFPVQLIPAVGSMVPYLVHGIAILVLLAYLAFRGMFTPMWLWMFPVLVLQLLFTMGLVAIISALCVFLRDVQQIVTLMLTAWFFMTPIIYPLEMLPEAFHDYMLFNPMHSFVDFYRELILLGRFDTGSFLILAPTAVIVYLLGGWFFMRIRHAFGDVL